MNAAKTTVSLIKASKNAWTRKWSFLVAFVIVLFITVNVCIATGFIPDTANADTASLAATTTPEVTLQTSSLIASAIPPAAPAAVAATDGTINMNGELPTKIVIPAAGVNATISNPSTLNVDDLDSYLSYGAARYPTSATLGEQGNMILFGHSSYLPIVNNKAYKTFDGIQNLAKGALITVYGNEGHTYTYAVTSVTKQNETTGFGIPLTTTGETLTISTCNSFATKQDRFIVTAQLVSTTVTGS
jgi:sortase (surface protein transpeptidase)